MREARLHNIDTKVGRCTVCGATYNPADIKADCPGLGEGIRYDSGKAPLSLLPSPAILEVGKALGFGARKYTAFNYRKGMGWRRQVDAALRHIFAWLEREDKDAESDLNPLAHAIVDLLFALQYHLTGTGTDDRYRPDGNSAK